MKMLIVESPTKRKHIAAFLGAGWVVEASFGHVRDLPKGEMGIDFGNYQPAYVLSDSGKKVMAKLKGMAKQMEEIWFATDPDREGEAIAWHLKALLGRGKIVRRVTFSEITQTAVLRAVQQPRDIDNNLVAAQQARRVLDRLYGYKLSPALGDKIGVHGVSAGRVQSIALRLIVDRERAIRNFRSTKHFGVAIVCESEGRQWRAKWDTAPFVTEESPYITDKESAEKVCCHALSGLRVTKFSEKEQQQMPPAPLITSTLQQAAANRLGLSVGTTMAAAQKLFEAGLITYMRTDNPNLSDEAIAALHDYLRAAGQDDHIADPPHRWKAKNGAQEAHEAIRPTDFALRIADSGDPVADQVYQLIRRAAIACQMRPAIYKVRKARLETLQPLTLTNVPTPATIPAAFDASGRELIYPGWQIIAKDYTNDDDKAESGQLPMLTEGQICQPLEAVRLELETRAPNRFTETSLLKILEKNEIGRPATYANIIETQLRRGYAVIKKRYFYPTELGERVIDALADRFDIMETGYTAAMEAELDNIAGGTADYLTVVRDYDLALDSQLADFIRSSIEEGSIVPCPQCENGKLRRINGQKGPFWGCSNYKEGCNYMAPDENGKPGKPKPKSTAYLCPQCGEGHLQRRVAKKGKGKYWWGCDRYPDCDYTAFDDKGRPKAKKI